jgi:hypothetical protein
MQKRSCVLFLVGVIVFLLISSHSKESYANPGTWQKIELNTQDDLRSILFYQDEVLIFSTTTCYVSKIYDLQTWETRSMPEMRVIPYSSAGPFLSHFKGRIFINGKNGIYFSSDGAKTWQSGFRGWFNAITADGDWLYLFQAHGSYRSSNGVDFENLSSLDVLTYPYIRRVPLTFTFAKAEKDRVILRGYGDTGMVSVFESLDQGVTWQKITDPNHNNIVDFCGNQQVLSTALGLFFLTKGCININQVGGAFRSVAKCNNDYYFCGLTNQYFANQEHVGEGIIMKNNDFTSALITPHRMRKVSSYGNTIIAVGEKGSVYVLRDVSQVPLSSTVLFLVFALLILATGAHIYCKK